MALEKATIINLETNERIEVMFNPAEYQLDLGNTFAEIGIPGLKTPPIQYVRGNLRNLKMELFFDTYEPHEPRPKDAPSDVRSETRRITSLMDKDLNTQAPPILLFSWGGLIFKCVLESAAQKFTMFIEDGTPVRATLTVSFKEFEPVDIEIEKGMFFGPQTVYQIKEGETLSDIAGAILGDTAEWRVIADLNDIDNPRVLVAGTPIIVPPRKTRVRRG